jgi:hypothetical protein
LGNLRFLFFFLLLAGRYIVEDLDKCGDPDYDDGRDQNVLDLLREIAAITAMPPDTRSGKPALVRELADSAAQVILQDKVGLVVKAAHHLFKLREAENDEVLDHRHGDAWETSVELRPARRFASAASVTSHGDGPIPSGSPIFDVPAQHLRRYSEVTCAALQIAVHGDYVLPDTWRHPHMRVLSHRHLVYASPPFARLKPEFAADTPRRLNGSYYFFDTEFPNHFGHITTEVLSRYWLMAARRAAGPVNQSFGQCEEAGRQDPGFPARHL